MIEITFFVTKTGNLGVSTDDGETIINHAGRRMPITAAWEETDGSVEDLTDAATEVLVEALKEAEDAEQAEADRMSEQQAETARQREEMKRAEEERKRLRAERAAARAAYLKTPAGQAEMRQLRKDLARVFAAINGAGEKGEKFFRDFLRS